MQKIFKIIHFLLFFQSFLLIDELDMFGDVPILTLGDPVLKLLVKNGFEANVNYYWGFEPGRDHPTRAFDYCQADRNLLTCL